MPSQDILDTLTTTMSPEDETIPPILKLERDPPNIDGSIDPSAVFLGSMITLLEIQLSSFYRCRIKLSA